jgi:hypothetical protein
VSVFPKVLTGFGVGILHYQWSDEFRVGSDRSCIITALHETKIELDTYFLTDASFLVLGKLEIINVYQISFKTIFSVTRKNNFVLPEE